MTFCRFVIALRITFETFSGTPDTSPLHSGCGDGEGVSKGEQAAAGFWKQAMTGVVRTLVFRVRKLDNTGDGSACGAQYPAGYQVDKNMRCWLGKDGRKAQDYGIPCRCENSCTHIGLREMVSYLPISSAGHFYFYSLS